MTEHSEKKGISRRTITKGAAWAVPVAPLIVATPAYAASGACLVLTSTGCKNPGSNNQFRYTITLKNNCSSPIEVRLVKKANGACFTNSPNCAGGNVPSSPITLAVGGSTTVTGYSTNSGNGIEAEYYIGGLRQTPDAFTPTPPAGSLDDCPA